MKSLAIACVRVSNNAGAYLVKDILWLEENR